MRLLAVDPASNIVGLAYFQSADDRRPQTAILRAPQGTETRPAGWLDKLEYFETCIQERSILWAPDVVAIEDVNAFSRNAHSLIVMAKAWGWLVHVLKSEYRSADWLEVNTATIRAALGLSSNADRGTRQRAARALFPHAGSQDEADAAAVGMTAYREIAKRRVAAGI